MRPNKRPGVPAEPIRIRRFSEEEKEAKDQIWRRLIVAGARKRHPRRTEFKETYCYETDDC